jgi:hypothetical protein
MFTNPPWQSTAAHKSKWLDLVKAQQVLLLHRDSNPFHETRKKVSFDRSIILNPIVPAPPGLSKLLPSHPSRPIPLATQYSDPSQPLFAI